MAARAAPRTSSLASSLSSPGGARVAARWGHNSAVRGTVRTPRYLDISCPPTQTAGCSDGHLRCDPAALGDVRPAVLGQPQQLHQLQPPQPPAARVSTVYSQPLYRYSVTYTLQSASLYIQSVNLLSTVSLYIDTVLSTLYSQLLYRNRVLSTVYS